MIKIAQINLNKFQGIKRVMGIQKDLARFLMAYLILFLFFLPPPPPNF